MATLQIDPATMIECPACGDDVEMAKLAAWRATHAYHGEILSLCPGDQFPTTPEDGFDPGELAGSNGAYTFCEWHTDEWPAIRLLPDGRWLRANPGEPELEDITAQVVRLGDG